VQAAQKNKTEKMRKKKAALSGGSSGGRNRTRTCDPIDVNDVLSPGAKVCEKRMQGVHERKTLDFTGLPRFRLHPPGVHRMGVHRVFTPF